MASLSDRFLSFDQQSRSLTAWLQQFGVEQEHRNLLQVVNCNQKEDHVYIDVDRILTRIRESKGRNELILREVIAFKLKQRFLQKLEEEQARIEAERKAREEAEAAEAEAVEEVPEPVPTKEEKRGKGKKPAPAPKGKQSTKEPEAKDTQDH